MEQKNINGKPISIMMNNEEFLRLPIQTHFVKIGENYLDIIEKYVVSEFKEGDIISISEKIIALCQNRVIYKDDLYVGFWAKFLSKFASKNNHGVGVSNELKMAYCIEKVGILKTLFAAIASGVSKIFGKRGVFYEIVGQEVAGLDGFYPNVFKEYGNYGIENPINCSQVCNEIERKFNVPCMIVDANDLGQELLGCSNKMRERFTEKEMISLIRDNPAGQGNSCTPLVLIRKNKI